MTALDQYRDLLDRYHALIRGSDWHDGQREELVRKMDAVWRTLMKREQGLER